MTDEQLQAWVNRISKALFDAPFRHQARFNRRLRAVGGRYAPRTGEIEISRSHYETFGAEEIESIIKHELCHYHLHQTGRGYKHRDSEFKALLTRVGGAKYCRALPGQRAGEPYRYRLQCARCGAVYMRKRRVNIRKYGCGKCRGKLKMFSLDSVTKS